MLTEQAIRAAVTNHVLRNAGKNAQAIYEFWVPRSYERADIAIVGNALHGFEIKSGRDSLKRLPRQVAAYSRVFDLNEAIVAPRHVERALDVVPDWWGLRVAHDDGPIDKVRPAAVNTQVDAEVLVRLLWRREAFEVAANLDPTVDPRAARHQLWSLVLDALDLENLKATVRRVLLARDPTTARTPSRRFAVSPS
jgi:hypothetical protein